MRRNAGFGVKYTRNPERSERVAESEAKTLSQSFPSPGSRPTPWRAATHSATLRGSGHSLYHTQGSAAIAAAPWAKNIPPSGLKIPLR